MKAIDLIGRHSWKTTEIVIVKLYIFDFGKFLFDRVSIKTHRTCVYKCT